MMLNYGDIIDMAKLAEAKYLISVTTDDVWSLDAEEMNSALDKRIVGSSELAIYEGEHMFRADMREYAYDFQKRAHREFFCEKQVKRARIRLTLLLFCSLAKKFSKMHLVNITKGKSWNLFK